MTDLRSPLEDRPYRPATRPAREEYTMSTPEYYRGKFDTLRQSRWFPLASVLAAVFVFSGVVSYAYKQGSQTGVNATTPIVTASTDSYKEKPENPGGLDVPFQDAIVFDQLQGQDQKTAAADSVESLLPPPEAPVAATTEAAAPTTTTTTAETTIPAAPTLETPTETTTTTAAAAVDTTVSDTVKTVNEKAKEATQAAAVKAQDTVTKTATEAKTATATVKETIKQKADVATAQTESAMARTLDRVAPAAAPANTAIQSGTYRIQLGSFREEAAARAAWNQYKQQFSSQLGSVTPDFPYADLGAKGVFYRAQGINLSKATADELCRSINAAKAGTCIVTK